MKNKNLHTAVAYWFFGNGFGSIYIQLQNKKSYNRSKTNRNRKCLKNRCRNVSLNFVLNIC